MRFPFPLLFGLAGCWLTEADRASKALSPPDTGAPTLPTTGLVTGSGTGTGTVTASGTTSTFVDLECVDKDIGSETGGFAAVGTTLGQLNDESSPCFGATTAGADVVHLWQAPSSGCFQVDTLGVAFDSVLYVRQPDCNGAELVCNDDQSGTTFASQVGFEASAGEDYLIVVDGRTVGEAGTYDLNIQTSTLIEPNTVEGTSAGPFYGNTVYSDTTLDPNACPYPSAQDHILEWTAPSTGTWRFELTANTDFDSVLSLHRQCSTDAVACQDEFNPSGGESIELPLYGGETLFVRIAGFDFTYYGYSVYDGNWELTITPVP